MNNALGLFIVMFAFVGCPKPQPAPSQKTVRANGVLTRVGKLAEDSYYACMVNGYLQGLPLAQIYEDCATKLLDDDKNGFGSGPLGEITAGRSDFFNPASISGACGNSGDPTISQGPGYGRVPGYGEYTYGGDPNKYWGMSKERAEAEKNANIAAAKAEEAKFDKLVDEELKKQKEVADAAKAGNAAAAAKAEEERKAAYQAALDQAAKAKIADDKAKEDPNKKPEPTSRTVDGESPCAQALAAATELLRECHRTNWKDFRCQQLKASMNACPDPALILVDPESGYTCGAKLDAAGRAALLAAWKARCEQRVRPMPDGRDPCAPPSIDEAGRYLRGKQGDVCNNPYAQTDPDGERCAVKFNINTRLIGQPDIWQIAILGMNKIGGPIVVIPNPKPPPTPGGPDPIPPPP